MRRRVQVGQDRWDYELRKRDLRVLEEQKFEMHMAKKAAEQARLEAEADALMAEERSRMGVAAPQDHHHHHA